MGRNELAAEFQDIAGTQVGERVGQQFSLATRVDQSAVNDLPKAGLVHTSTIRASRVQAAMPVIGRANVNIA
jgi:hypothetical protein